MRMAEKRGMKCRRRSMESKIGGRIDVKRMITMGRPINTEKNAIDAYGNKRTGVAAEVCLRD